MAEQETLRLLLQKTIERNDGLVKMNHEATLAIPTILGAVWGILIIFKDKTDAISIFALITIGILFFWRCFAHYIDDDIASNYSRIMRIENHLEISEDCSIYLGLIHTITKSFNDKHLQEKCIKLCKEQRIELIDRLYDNKLLGYRGHEKWDFFAFILISLNLVLFLQLLLNVQCAEVALLLIICVISLTMFYFVSPIQRNPTKSKFCEFVENAKKILPKNENH